MSVPTEEENADLFRRAVRIEVQAEVELQLPKLFAEYLQRLLKGTAVRPRVEKKVEPKKIPRKKRPRCSLCQMAMNKDGKGGYACIKDGCSSSA